MSWMKCDSCGDLINTDEEPESFQGEKCLCYSCRPEISLCPCCGRCPDGIKHFGHGETPNQWARRIFKEQFQKAMDNCETEEERTALFCRVADRIKPPVNEREPRWSDHTIAEIGA